MKHIQLANMVAVKLRESDAGAVLVASENLRHPLLPYMKNLSNQALKKIGVKRHGNLRS